MTSSVFALPAVTIQRTIAIICVVGASCLHAEIPEEFQRRLGSEMTSQHAFIGQAPLFKRVEEMGMQAGVPRSELIELLLGWIEQGHRLPDNESNARARVLASTSAGVAARLGDVTLIPLLERYAVEAEDPMNLSAARAALGLAFREDPVQIPVIAQALAASENLPLDILLSELVPRESPLASRPLTEEQAIVLSTIRQLYFSADADDPIYADQTLMRGDPAHQHSESRYQFLMRLRTHEKPRRQTYAEDQLIKDFTERLSSAPSTKARADAPGGRSARPIESEADARDYDGPDRTIEERRFRTGALIVALLVSVLLYVWMRFMRQ